MRRVIVLVQTKWKIAGLPDVKFAIRIAQHVHVPAK
jgi:hypothetical protein